MSGEIHGTQLWGNNSSVHGHESRCLSRPLLGQVAAYQRRDELVNLHDS